MLMLFQWKPTFEKKIIWVVIYSNIHNGYHLLLAVQKKEKEKKTEIEYVKLW